MPRDRQPVTPHGWTVAAVAWAVLVAGGCVHGPQHCSCGSTAGLLCDPASSDIPRELAKGSLPPYVIEPPDILLVDALRVIPQPPYRIEPLDILVLRVLGVPETAPIQGLFSVDPDGTVQLGLEYGTVRLAGLTLEEARAAIEQRLRAVGLKEPRAQVSLYQSRAVQQIRGEHLVRPDGTISLGLYGSAYVTGMTIPEAKAAIQSQLARYLVQPEVSVDVLAYNSKVFYVVTDGGGFGQQVVRLAATGNETVLDAISQVNGLSAVASQRHIWVARPAPARTCGDQILPVDWKAIVECGRTETNYQVLPGDRIYVKADALITTDNWLTKIITPIERLFGVTLLGNETVRSFGSRGTGGTGTGF